MPTEPNQRKNTHLRCFLYLPAGKTAPKCSRPKIEAFLLICSKSCTFVA